MQHKETVAMLSSREARQLAEIEQYLQATEHRLASCLLWHRFRLRGLMADRSWVRGVLASLVMLAVTVAGLEMLALGMADGRHAPLVAIATVLVVSVPSLPYLLLWCGRPRRPRRLPRGHPLTRDQ